MKSVEGIILKKTPRREADLVISLYTKEHGLMDFQAKSVRKGVAKLKSGLDVFNQVELFFVSAKYLPIITDFKIKNDFKVVKSNLKRLKLASFWASALVRILEPGFADEKLWQKISEHFSLLNDESHEDFKLVNAASVLCYQVLELNGLQPELTKCVKCEKVILSENLSVSLVNGGIVHYDCLNNLKTPQYHFANSTIVLTRDVLNLVRNLSAKEYKSSSDENFNRETWSDFKVLSGILFEYHFGINVSKLI